jgi:hypothetical protein
MIEDAIKALVEPILAAVSPAVPFRWGRVESGLDEYVGLSGVIERKDPLDDFAADNKQLTIVTRSGMARAKAIDLALQSGLQRAKGVYSGMKIQSISYVRSVELPDTTTGEDIIASEYQITYEGGI